MAPVLIWRFKYDNDLNTVCDSNGRVITVRNIERREAFFNWLADRVSAAQLSDYYATMSDLEHYCIAEGLISGSMFDLEDPVAIQGIKASRPFERIFRHFNRRNGKMMVSICSCTGRYRCKSGREAGRR